MSKGIKVAYVATAVNPFCNVDIGERIKFLSDFSLKLGFGVKVFVPKLDHIIDKSNKLHQIFRLSGLNIKVGDKISELLVKYTSIQEIKTQIYFVDGGNYFRGENFSYDEDGFFDKENDSKCIFFCRGILETLFNLGWSPDIIHCYGWIGAFLPFLIKNIGGENEFFSRTKILYSLNEKVLEESFSGPIDYKLGIESGGGLDKNYSMKDLLRFAIKNSDIVSIEREDLVGDFVDYIKDLGVEILKFDTSNGCYLEVYNKLISDR